MKYSDDCKVYRIRYYNVWFYLFAKTEMDEYKINILGERIDGAITANYWLSEIYDQEIADAHKSGAIHLHDLSMLTGYCAGWSLKQLIQQGLGGRRRGGLSLGAL